MTPPLHRRVKAATADRHEPFTARELAEDLGLETAAGLYAPLNELVDVGLLIEDTSVRPKTFAAPQR